MNCPHTDAERAAAGCHCGKLVEALERLLKFNRELCEDIGVSTHYPSAENAEKLIAAYRDSGAAGCPVCLRAERDKLVAQHGRDTGIIFSLRGEVDEWKRNAEKQYANLQNVTVLTTKVKEERDRLRQALERIANDYKHGLLTYQTWAREALGAKEDRP